MVFSVKQEALLSEGNGSFTKQKNCGVSWEQFCDYSTVPLALCSKFCMRDLTSNMCIA